MKRAGKTAIFASIIFIFFISTFYAESDIPQWQDLALLSTHGNIYLATSELKGGDPYEFGPYGAHNLFDGNSTTCWAEGVKGYGKGQSLYIAVDKGVRKIYIINGYTKSKALFLKNSRIKKFKLSLYIGINEPGHVTETHTMYKALKHNNESFIELKDITEPQPADFPFKWSDIEKFREESLNLFLNNKNNSYKKGDLDVRYILNLEIADVYKGSKYDDTCVSEIAFNGIIKSVYLNKDENAVLCKTIAGEEITLLSDKNSVFQILEMSGNKKWIIVIKMAAQITRSRVETEHLLINAESKKVLRPSEISKNAGEFTGFEERDGKIFIGFLDLKTFKPRKAELE